VKATVAMLGARALVVMARRSRASVRHLILTALFTFLLLLPAVQVLVDGIARSGLWLENPPKRRARREHAADFVGRFYFRQDPRLLKWALTNPIDRVQYQPLTPLRKDFELIVRLMRETGVLDRDIAFEEYIDVRFAENAQHQTEWRYEPGDATAE
jgi:NitT/TauT family transport system substrate-binding protein